MTFGRTLLAVFVLASGALAAVAEPYPATVAPGDFVAPLPGATPSPSPTGTFPGSYEQASPAAEQIDPGPVVSEPALQATPYFNDSVVAPPDARFDGIRLPYPTTVSAESRGLRARGARYRTWYTRVDAFHWGEDPEFEDGDSEDLVNEWGALVTIGYAHRSQKTRFRLEVFGGVMDYEGYVQGGGYYADYEQSNGTGYLGFRGELEYLIEPSRWTRNRMVLGIGARIWHRDLYDGQTEVSTLEGHRETWDVHGYQETWYTVYPYFGFESKDPVEPGAHFFYTARLGFMPWTHETVSFGPSLRPKGEATGQLELGMRGERLLFSVMFEIASWGESPVVDDYFQPSSIMSTIGLRFAYCF